MKYRNTKTGNIIDVKSKVKGKYWEPADDPDTKSDNTKAAGKGKAKSDKTTKDGENTDVTVSDSPQGKAGD